MKTSFYPLSILMAAAGAFAIAPALAQQGAGQQGSGQPAAPQNKMQFTQEAAQGSGAQLFVSPSVVRLVQQALNQAGFDAGKIDGTWSQGTQNAMRTYQQSRGLEPTGNLNLISLNSLGLLQSALSGQSGQAGQVGAQSSAPALGAGQGNAQPGTPALGQPGQTPAQ